MDDPFEIAVEHVAWCLRQRLTPSEVLAAVGVRLVTPDPNWQQVTWVLARKWQEELATRRSGGAVIAPFRDPKPKRRAYA